MSRFLMVVFSAGTILPALAFAAPPINSSLILDVAIDGYDPVTYFSGTPQEGSAQFTARWRGATWRFVDTANRDRFVDAPEHFAPQYGGYCAWAMARGEKADVDPEVWRIVDGRLYLNYSPEVQKKWEADIPGHIRSADEHYLQLSQ